MEALPGVRSGFRPRRDLIAAKFGIICASETEQHHALYCAVRRFRRAGGGWAGLEHCLCIYSKTYTEGSDLFVPMIGPGF